MDNKPGGAERDIMEKRFTEIAERLREIEAKIKFLKAEQAKTSSILKELCDGETQSFNGYTYKLIERKGVIKYATIPELKDIDLEPYRADNSLYWKLNYDEQFEL